MDNMSLIYNLNLCRICQIPKNLDLVNTSSSLYNGKTFMDLVKFIFKDIAWEEDTLISLTCHICIKKIKAVAEFKSICLESNSRRGALNNVIYIKLETEGNTKDSLTEVDEGINNDSGGPEIEAMRDGETSELEESFVIFEEQISTKTRKKKQLNNIESPTKGKRKKKDSTGKPRGRPKKETCQDKLNDTLKKQKVKRKVTARCHRCDICCMQIKSLEEFDRHMNRHNGSRNYVCTVCGKTYITRDDLKQHSYRHNTEAIYTCPTCSKKYRTARDLRTHKKIVHSNREDFKYVCTECGAKFPQLCALKSHILRRHSKIRDFKCDMCGKDFAEKRDLQEHFVSHTNVRAFKCDLCPAEYKRRDVLFNHKSKHHGIGNYKFPVEKKVACRFCARMIVKDKLARHIRTHTGVKPFCCRLCDTKFNCKSYIKGHLKTKHDMDVEAADFNIKLHYDVVEEPAIEDSDMTEAIRENAVAEEAPLSS